MNNARSLICSCARVARCLRGASLAISHQHTFVNLLPQRMAISSSSCLNASAKVRILKQPVRLTPTKAPLVLTPKAVSRVKELLSERPGVIGLRIGVRTRGCSGLSYTLDYVEEKKTPDAEKAKEETENRTLVKDIGRTQLQSHDVEVQQDGVRIFIDRRAQLTLLGTEMDFVETKMGAEFVFANPNIKSTCGCGESFMLS